jgi:hypothetical protein
MTVGAVIDPVANAIHTTNWSEFLARSAKVKEWFTTTTPQRSVSAAYLRRYTGMLCSINPMGTPTTPLVFNTMGPSLPVCERDLALVDLLTGQRWCCPTTKPVVEALHVIGTGCRDRYKDCCLVGRLLHAITHGSYWGFEVWNGWWKGPEEPTIYTGRDESDRYIVWAPLVCGRVSGDEWANIGSDIDHIDPMCALTGLVHVQWMVVHFPLQGSIRRRRRTNFTVCWGSGRVTRTVGSRIGRTTR